MPKNSFVAEVTFNIVRLTYFLILKRTASGCIQFNGKIIGLII